jgi:hypothetical protein
MKSALSNINTKISYLLSLGQVWGSIGNLNMMAYRALTPVNEETERLKDLILRLCRLSFQLTFLAVQGDGEIGHLVEKGLLTEKEKHWLDAATIGTRPLMVVDWIYKYFDVLKQKGYNTSEVDFLIHSNIQSLR